MDRSVMTDIAGLERYASHLHPAILADIEKWTGHPQLAKLHAALTAHRTRKNFLNAWAEAIIARHLLRRGCDLEVEVPTPSGKACDFRVTLGGQEFFLHVKRLETDRPGRRKLTISSRLRYLERINRPYVVGVRWREGASDEQMQRLVRSASDFILHARVGDELVVHDDEGREIGGVLIVAPWEGPHVSLAIGLPSGFIDEAPRMRKLLRRAYRQFMPRAANVILICSSHADEHEEFENALLGSHVERWDAFPPRGRRIAHGRAADGFWQGQTCADSAVAGWFPFALEDERPRARLWFRPGALLDEDLRSTLRALFDDRAADSAAASRAGA
jgi:hypothetical protein